MRTPNNCFSFVYFLITSYFLLLYLFVVQYKYSYSLVYVYCRKHALCTTWFLNSPFSYGEPSPVHQTTIIWLRILGPACQRKRHSHKHCLGRPIFNPHSIVSFVTCTNVCQNPDQDLTILRFYNFICPK